MAFNLQRLREIDLLNFFLSLLMEPYIRKHRLRNPCLLNAEEHNFFVIS